MQGRQARWYGVITLFVFIAISYIDRINIAVLITDAGFLQHVGLERTDRVSQGLLATAFMVGYGISSVVLTPFAAALLGVRRSLLVGLTLWGVVTFLSPALDSFGLLLGSRILLGVSEGPVFALAGAYIKAHFESRENGKPNSFVNMGTGLGLAIGFPLVGALLASHDWQTSFHVLGLINILLGIPLVLAFVRMPKVNEGAARGKSAGAALAQVGQMVRGAMHTRHLVLVTVMTSAFLAYLWGSSNWLPTYLKEARGFSLKEMGWLASLPQYATVVAVLIGGVVIDRIQRKSVPLMFVWCSLGVAAFVWLAIETDSRYLAAYSLIAANFCWGLMSPAIPSTVQHFSRPEHVASSYGVVNGVGSLVAGFMPALMGGVIAHASSPKIGFLAGFGALIGTQLVVVVCGLVLWRRERQPQGQGAQAAPAKAA
ncbi:MAG TPA: MFS transporter [Variovorax sp.]|nr:MFS transporter [Variovorax sp.]